MARVSATEREATRRRLLDAAKAEFARRGLAGARFDEISLAAGCAKGTIYNYFPSKPALFLAVVSDWCQVLVDAVSAAAGSPDPRQRLLAIAAADVAIAEKDPELARVVVQQMPALVGDDREATLAAIEPGLDLLREVFDDGLRSGAFAGPLTAEALARLFLAVLSAIELEALTDDAPIELAAVVDLVDRHFITGLIPANDRPRRTR